MIGRHSAAYFLPHRGSSNENAARWQAPLVECGATVEIAAFSNFGVSAG